MYFQCLLFICFTILVMVSGGIDSLSLRSLIWSCIVSSISFSFIVICFYWWYIIYLFRFGLSEIAI